MAEPSCVCNNKTKETYICVDGKRGPAWVFTRSGGCLLLGAVLVLQEQRDKEPRGDGLWDMLHLCRTHFPFSLYGPWGLESSVFPCLFLLAGSPHLPSSLVTPAFVLDF